MSETSSVAATAAMWPVVLPGGRPVGRRAATRWIDLSCSAGALAEAFIIRQTAGHRQVADFKVERP